MNLANNPSVPDTTNLREFESIEALLRADAERQQPIDDDGFTARVMVRLFIQHAESPWRWALPNLIVVLGVMTVLLTGTLMQGLEQHLLTGSVLALPIGIAWPSLVVAAAVSLGVYFSMDVPWPWGQEDPVREST
jgi:hypothetical protein